MSVMQERGNHVVLLLQIVINVDLVGWQQFDQSHLYRCMFLGFNSLSDGEGWVDSIIEVYYDSSKVKTQTFVYCGSFCSFYALEVSLLFGYEKICSLFLIYPCCNFQDSSSDSSSDSDEEDSKPPVKSVAKKDLPTSSKSTKKLAAKKADNGETTLAVSKKRKSEDEHTDDGPAKKKANKGSAVSGDDDEPKSAGKNGVSPGQVWAPGSGSKGTVCGYQNQIVSFPHRKNFSVMPLQVSRCESATCRIWLISLNTLQYMVC